jgi:hypothetical protein
VRAQKLRPCLNSTPRGGRDATRFAPWAESQIKVPADFVFDQGKDSPGPVGFSHEQHKAQGGEMLGVPRPGLQDEEGHYGSLDHGEDEGDGQCGACHNAKTEIAGKTVFPVDDKANCERCHKKK